MDHGEQQPKISTHISHQPRSCKIRACRQRGWHMGSIGVTSAHPPTAALLLPMSTFLPLCQGCQKTRLTPHRRHKPPQHRASRHGEAVTTKPRGTQQKPDAVGRLPSVCRGQQRQHWALPLRNSQLGAEPGSRRRLVLQPGARRAATKALTHAQPREQNKHAQVSLIKPDPRAESFSLFNGRPTRRAHRHKSPGVTFPPGARGRGRDGGGEAAVPARSSAAFITLFHSGCAKLRRNSARPEPPARPSAPSPPELGVCLSLAGPSASHGKRALCDRAARGLFATAPRAARARTKADASAPLPARRGYRKTIKPRRENSRPCRYRRADKHNATETPTSGAPAAESPATQRGGGQPAPALPPRSPSGSGTSRLTALGAAAPAAEAAGGWGAPDRTQDRGFRTQTSLPAFPTAPRRHPPAPADRTAARGEKLNPFPPRSRLGNHPRTLPKASAPLLSPGFATFPPCSVTSVWSAGDTESPILPTEYIQKTLGLFRKQLAAVQRKMVFSDG